VAETVRAAGGVVRRRSPDGGWDYAVIHRPKYNDWSLPKGKLDDSETWEKAALREVEEETGLKCRLDRELGETRYTDSRGSPKIVKYWLMTPQGGQFTPTIEVDEIRWLSTGEALNQLSYDHDRDFLRTALLGESDRC
jgi:8-oxo-dGTP pyrophosphatase MutT (NUDIX family)